jgi:phage portal protein BeeE
MDLIRGLVSRPSEARDANLSALLEAAGRRMATWAGPYVSELTAMQHLTVWSCISLISDAVGMLPLHAYRPPASVGAAPTRIETPEVLLRPHVDMDRYEWDVRMLWALLMRGNAYGWVIDRESNGAPSQVLPLHPDEGSSSGPAPRTSSSTAS